MRPGHKNISHKITALFLVFIFSVGEIFPVFLADAHTSLAPSLRFSSDVFKEQYLAKTTLLSHKAVNGYIGEQVRNIGWDKIEKRRDNIGIEKGERQEILILKIPGLLKNTGQLAHVGLGQKNGVPTIYIDSRYYYIESVLSHEKDEISKWEGKRRSLGLDPNGMREWILQNPGEAKNIAADFHGTSREVDSLYQTIRENHDNFLDLSRIYAAYLSYGFDVDDNDVNIASGEGPLKQPGGKKNAEKWGELEYHLARISGGDADSKIASIDSIFSALVLGKLDPDKKLMNALLQSYEREDSSEVKSRLMEVLSVYGLKDESVRKKVLKKIDFKSEPAILRKFFLGIYISLINDITRSIPPDVVAAMKIMLHHNDSDVIQKILLVLYVGMGGDKHFLVDARRAADKITPLFDPALLYKDNRFMDRLYLLHNANDVRVMFAADTLLAQIEKHSGIKQPEGHLGAGKVMTTADIWPAMSASRSGKRRQKYAHLDPKELEALWQYIFFNGQSPHNFINDLFAEGKDMLFLADNTFGDKMPLTIEEITQIIDKGGVTHIALPIPLSESKSFYRFIWADADTQLNYHPFTGGRISKKDVEYYSGVISLFRNMVRTLDGEVKFVLYGESKLSGERKIDKMAGNLSSIFAESPNARVIAFGSIFNLAREHLASEKQGRRYASIAALLAKNIGPKRMASLIYEDERSIKYDLDIGIHNLEEIFSKPVFTSFGVKTSNELLARLKFNEAVDNTLGSAFDGMIIRKDKGDDPEFIDIPELPVYDNLTPDLTPAGAGKGSPADLLETIKGDNTLLKKMVDRNEGITIKIMARYRPFSRRTVEREFEVLKKLGVFVNVDGKHAHYRFSDMMTSQDLDYTRTLINAINDIHFEVGESRLYDERPLHCGNIPEEKIPTIKELIRMAVLEQVGIMTEMSSFKEKDGLIKDAQGLKEDVNLWKDPGTSKRSDPDDLLSDRNVKDDADIFKDAVSLSLRDAEGIRRRANEEGDIGQLLEVDMKDDEKLVVIGDLHAEQQALEEILARTDGSELASGKTRIVILGDIMSAINPREYAYFKDGSGNSMHDKHANEEYERNSGKRGYELLLRIAELKCKYPKSIFVLPGNSELGFKTKTAGKPFRLLFDKSTGDAEDIRPDRRDIYDATRTFIDSMPLFVIISIQGKRYLFSHGGIMRTGDSEELFRGYDRASLVNFKRHGCGTDTDFQNSIKHNYLRYSREPGKDPEKDMKELYDSLDIDYQISAHIHELFSGSDHVKRCDLELQKIEGVDASYGVAYKKIHVFHTMGFNNQYVYLEISKEAKNATGIEAKRITKKYINQAEKTRRGKTEGVNLNNEIPPAPEENKVLWHILENGLLADEQKSSFAQQVNNLSRRSEGRERIWILKDGETIKSAIDGIKKITPEAIFDVALSSAAHIGAVPERDGDNKIKMLVFEGEASNFRHINGMVYALRALHLENEKIMPALLAIYAALTGEKYKGEIPPLVLLNNPREFAKKFIFVLPPAEPLPVEDIPKVNARLMEVMTAM